MKKTGRFVLIASLVLCLALSGCFVSKVKAAENDSLIKKVEDTIDSDKIEFGKLSPLLEKAYQKLVSAFKKVGSLAKDISKVVKLYNDLDETSDDYAEKLQEFIDEYNKLGTIKRKVVDFCTGFLDAKDKIVESLRSVVTVDMYSVRELTTKLNGNIVFKSENVSIADVSEDGLVEPCSIGIAKIVAENDAGETETFRVVVKKPILSRSVKIKNGKTAVVTLPSGTVVNDVEVSNANVDYKLDGSQLELKALSKGTAYVYVGTTEGKTLKYKVKIS